MASTQSEKSRYPHIRAQGESKSPLKSGRRSAHAEAFEVAPHKPVEARDSVLQCVALPRAISAVRLLVALAAIYAGSGCAVIGPAAIKNGRAAYNDAITSSNIEQVLAMIVRLRYGESSGLLAVSSVTANMHIQTTLGSELGFGPDSTFDGNLTPLSAGVAYEENPTISYVPIQGAQYLRQMMSPLPLDVTLLLFQGMSNSPRIFSLLVRSINGRDNPEFRAAPEVAVDPRFVRIASLLAEMDRHGRVAWVQDSIDPPSFAMVLGREGARRGPQIDDIYELLGLPIPDQCESVCILPVSHGLGIPGEVGIRLRTRSLFDLLNIAAASVEVPEEHLQSGLAPALPPSAQHPIRIRRSGFRPSQALVAVRRHGWWYSIDGTDAASKQTFRVIEVLMTVRLADAAEHRAAPVLTIPVSR